LNYIEKNNLQGKSTIGIISYKDFLTAGIMASKSELFWKSWKHSTFTKWNNFKGFKDNNPLMVEQDIFNLIFYSGQFKTKVVDNDSSGVFYGTQSREKWNQLKLNNHDITLDGRKVRIMHWAGGNGVEKLNYRKSGIPEDVCKRLDILIS
ncbi:MAG: hypothetical protein M1445_08535, partial [Bacteroidetes bacterium]|nr:hypothetical protein [Bacteroidota bacterium]